MRVLGAQMDYLGCAYETKYYIIDKVDSQINAIHDDSLELTEFKGCFSPFDLDKLEMKVCRLADRNKYEDDLPEHQDALQAQDSNSNLGSHNSEEMTGKGFDPNNYSPIPPVGNVASQQGAALPTLTPKPVVGADMNTLDPTHNRGKVKIINSFATNQEQVETMRKPSKGGKVKSSHARSQAQPSTSTQGSNALPVEVQIILEKTAVRIFLHKMQNKVSHHRNVLCAHKNRYEQHHMYLLW